MKFLAVTCLLAFSLPAAAGLQGRAPLTPGGTDYQAWYDDRLGITWLGNANLAASNRLGVTGIDASGRMNWATANTWILALNASRHLGVNSWRLPATRPVNGYAFNYANTFNGTTDVSYNVGGPGTPYADSSGSEFAHLYYNTLGNLGYCSPASTGACIPQTGYGPVNKAPFSNLTPWWYWTGTTYGPDPTKAWFFAFDDGSQWGPSKSLTTLHVWPVADGDVLASTAQFCPAGLTGPDTDGDGVPDLCDNCTQLANPDQTDTDRDGYGNRCDGDLNENGFTNAQDTVLFRTKLGTSDPIADFNNNGFVNAQDTTLFRTLLGKPPGPSGLRSAPTAFQSAPAPGFGKRVPVVLINFIPTRDGTHIDTSVWEGRPWGLPAEWGGTLLLSDVRSYISDVTSRVKFALEEGSRFRGYANPAAPPALGYEVLEVYNFHVPVPAAGRQYPGSTAYLPDLHKILSWIPAKRLVEVNGVQEFWVNVHEGWGQGEVVFPESNMSSPLTGDISNSHRFHDDLPVFANSYVVYGTNYLRSQSEAIHNHGHQFEAMLSHANTLQDGNSSLFWGSFVGQTNGEFVTGRCGWTHMPPNTTGNYDYLNPTLVQSDCEDWRPDGSGVRTLVNVNTWGGKAYGWPTATSFAQKDEAQFYIYWMQNMPGLGNQIPYGATTMENWWSIIGDWDEAMAAGKGLHR